MEVPTTTTTFFDMGTARFNFSSEERAAYRNLMRAELQRRREAGEVNERVSGNTTYPEVRPHYAMYANDRVLMGLIEEELEKGDSPFGHANNFIEDVVLYHDPKDELVTSTSVFLSQDLENSLVRSMVDSALSEE